MPEIYLSNNLKLLRARKKRSQDEAAFALNIKRSTLSKLEHTPTTPTVQVLINLSVYYKMPIDTLLLEDLSNMPASKLTEIEMSYKER